MNIWSISLKNIKSKPLYTFLSVFILSLSIVLLLGVQQLKTSFKNQIDNNIGNIDLVIGAKGSPLQLVLSSVLHIDNPTGNIPYSEAKKIKKLPLVKTVVPISYGDNYKGFRIVGTVKSFTTLYKAKLHSGRFVKNAMEVVLGSTVAGQLNLKIGDRLFSSHGLIANNLDIHSEALIVVGILQPSKKVIDRLIITNLESVWDVHEHNEGHSEHEHHHDESDDDDKEVTSLLIKLKSPRALLTLPAKVNKHTDLQAALPKYQLNKLYNYTSIGFNTISWIAYIILGISCITIFISLYKMVKERAFDLALLRTYGATNFQLIKMVLYEALIITISAFIIGWLLLNVLFKIVLNTMIFSSQVNMITNLEFQDLLQIGVVIFSMVILSVALAIYPIVNLNISRILSHEK